MLPRQGEGRDPSSDPGRITRAMRALARTGPRRLRVALVRGGRIEEERLMPEGAAVFVGPSERATFVVPHLERTRRLFSHGPGGYSLALPEGLSARVHDGGGVTEHAGGARVELGPEARGSIRLGELLLLFQLVVAPPKLVAQLPLALLRDPEHVDLRTTLIAALSFLLHFGAIGSLYSDWVDPVFDEAVTISGVVSELTTLKPPPEVDAAPTTATDTPSSTPGPAKGTKPGPSARAPAQSPDASLRQSLEQIEADILGALGKNGPATDRILRTSEVPTAALDEAAKSARGISGGGPLVLSGRAPIVPGSTTDLSSLANTGRDVKSSDTGHQKQVAGPRPSTHASVSQVQGEVSDAASVVAGLRAGFRSCYKQGLDLNPEASGAVRVTIQVGPNGEVSGVSTASSGNLPPVVAACVATRTKNAAFKSPPGGSAVIVVPVTFVLQE